MILYDTLKFSLARQREFLEYIRKKGIKKMTNKEEVELFIENLDKLNSLYNQGFVTIEEFSSIRDRLIEELISNEQEY